MAIASITYKQLSDVVVSWIQTNCKNIASFSSIEAQFKSGYTSGKVRYAGNDASPSCYTINLTGNAVASVSADTVVTDMTNFLSSCGLTDLNKEIPASEFLDFVKNLIVFCSTKIVIVASQLVSSKYICYHTANTTYNTKYQIDTNDARKIIMANDVIQLLDNITNIVRQSIRNKTCQYSITMSA